MSEPRDLPDHLVYAIIDKLGLIEARVLTDSFRVEELPSGAVRISWNQWDANDRLEEHESSDLSADDLRGLGG